MLLGIWKLIVAASHPSASQNTTEQWNYVLKPEDPRAEQLL